MPNPHLDFLSHVQANFKNSSSLGLEGTIDGKTYNPQDGTVQMVVGEGYTDCYDDSYQPYEVIGTLLTPQVGNLAAPWGGERAVAIPTRGGWRLMLTHGEDDSGNSDSPGTPQGEWWYKHAKSGTVGAGLTVAWDSGFKITNSGTTDGDGLGGAHWGNDADLTVVKTATGFQSQYSDTLQTIVHSTPGGITGTYSDILQSIQHAASGEVYSLIDAAGMAISHVVPSVGGLVGLGDLAGSLSKGANAATRFTDLNDTVKNQITQLIGNSIIQFVTAVGLGGGSFGALSSTDMIAYLETLGGVLPNPASFFALLPSLHGITVPACSQTVLIK